MLIFGLALAGGGSLHLMTYSKGQGAQAASLATCVDSALARRLERLYPCVELSSFWEAVNARRPNDPVRWMLLDGSVTDRDWPAIVGPLGIRYVVATRVTMGTNSLQVASNLVRAADGKAITGKISNLEKGAGVRECEKFAENFAKQLRYVPAFSRDSCPPPKP
jgi:hypothetical protein